MTYQQPSSPFASGSMLAPPRPTYVTVLAIIGIVLASLGILGSVIAVAIPLVSGSVASMSRDPQLQQAMALSSTEKVASIVQGIIGLALAIFLLIASIASLKLKPGFQKMMITWAIAYLAMTLVSLIVGVVLLAPAAIERNRAVQVSSGRQVTEAEQAGAKFGAYGGPVCGSVVGVIYPIFVLIFMRRPLPDYAPMTGYAPNPIGSAYDPSGAAPFPPQDNPNPDASRQWQQQDPNDPPTPPNNQQWPPNA